MKYKPEAISLKMLPQFITKYLDLLYMEINIVIKTKYVWLMRSPGDREFFLPAFMVVGRE